MEPTQLLTSFIALIAVYIAYQQWETNRQKLRLDLYQKRFAVYENVLAFYHILYAGDHVTDKERFAIENNFIKSCRESQFLFCDKDGIFQLLNAMSSKTPILKNVTATSRAYRGDPEGMIKVLEDHSAAMTFVENAIPELEKKLAKYLNFHKAH